MSEFCEWFVKQNGVTAIAHNAGGFDAHFVMDYLYQKGIKPLDITYKGMKIMKAMLYGKKLQQHPARFIELRDGSAGTIPQDVWTEGDEERLLSPLFQYEDELGIRRPAVRRRALRSKHDEG